MTRDEILARLRAAAFDVTGIAEAPGAARLRGDLSLDGDDAREFFETIERETGYAGWRPVLGAIFHDEVEMSVARRLMRGLGLGRAKTTDLTLDEVADCIATGAPLPVRVPADGSPAA